jgi:hypothetical protein
MTNPTETTDAQSTRRGRTAKPRFLFRFTPAEWRRLLEDAAFLRHPGNSYRPRRLMGVAVLIVPDHRFG